ncbi:ATP phosphoribosyltransferase regulatory subunit [Mesobacterium pallidum]|uniref:ATP phosphoribosyltransferase regulatory subunit n=1 Tax=Mesobacterium pallidum TaxID=2872037 RepID=UPI001EE15BB6|nr:ATP phosphoribosyltransferase regulatory subunit [Mesobacterium pallidum]
MPELRRTKEEAQGLLDRFLATGASQVDTGVLQPAGTLLDLYGEDIRARAFVTHDPLRGELMLRPDFTVPVVQRHMAEGAEPARYTYMGEVFRMQEDEALNRPTEYIQVGYEIFDRENPAEADAEVYALIREALAPLHLHAATGDIGILIAAVQGLATSERRKAALMRHLWRPRRFRALLERFSGKRQMPDTRRALLDGKVTCTAPQIGLRSAAEVADRIDALREDAATPPISREQLDLVEAVAQVKETCPFALERLRDLAVDLPAIADAVDRLAARIDALAARGVDVEQLDFEATYGRTSMEYYDGFVFGFYASGRPDLPPVATGGRYDALTRQLGAGREIPAVGGVIRPGLAVELGGLSA